MSYASGEVADFVQEVNSAFDTAIGLVRQIEDRRDERDDSEAVRDLSKSLALGPAMVQSCFDTGSDEMRPASKMDDDEALRLRHVLFSLKTVVDDLSDVLLNDKSVDFKKLQYSSDTCRVNAGVSLKQLSQRLAVPMTMYSQRPSLQYFGGPSPRKVDYPSSHFSSSESPHSSGRGWPPPVHDPYSQFKERNLRDSVEPSEPGKGSNNRFERRNSEISLQDIYSHWSDSTQGHSQSEVDAPSTRRRSSTTLAPEDGARLSPCISLDSTPGQHALPGLHDPVRDSQSSFGASGAEKRPAMRSAAISHQGLLDRGMAESDRISPVEQHNASENARKLPRRPPRLPLKHQNGDLKFPSSRNPIPQAPLDRFTEHKAIGEYRLFPVREPNSREPQQVSFPPRNESRPNPAVTESLPSMRSAPVGPSLETSPSSQMTTKSNHRRQRAELPIPEVAAHIVRPSPGPRPLPTLPPPNHVSQSSSPSHQTVLQSPPQTQPNSTRPPFFASTPLPAYVPLNLPTEKNLQPFCKGAFRLFVGLNESAFVPAIKPVGIAGSKRYWRCDKCYFEGTIATVPGPPDKKGRPGKPVKVFDSKIREYRPPSTAANGPDGHGAGGGGIRYRWAFLAKCHVPLKIMPFPSAPSDGTIGGYGCIFCMAEGASRGWSLVGGVTDATSLSSRNSGTSTENSATPVFKDLRLFMDHLQSHRQEENWPCQEMQMRAKCVVGRVAEPGEDWDINFLPV